MCCSFLLHANGSSFQAFLGDPSPKETARGVATNRRFRGLPELIISLLPSDYSDPSTSPVSGFPDFLSCFIFVSLPPSLCICFGVYYTALLAHGQCISQVGGCVVMWALWSGPSEAREVVFRATCPLPPLRRLTSPFATLTQLFFPTPKPLPPCVRDVCVGILI